MEEINARLARRLDSPAEYGFGVRYRSCVSNKAVDFLFSINHGEPGVDDFDEGETSIALLERQLNQESECALN